MKIEVNLSVKNLETNKTFAQPGAGMVPVLKNTSTYELEGKNQDDTLRMLMLNVASTFLGAKCDLKTKEYAAELIKYQNMFNLGV
jgi:hypothetical protein